METEELIELREEVKDSRDRGIGVTMAITAAFLAAVTMMGHRLHTEEVIMQTKSVDGWAFYQAKNGRSHLYATDAKLAELTGAAGAAPLVAEWTKKAAEERQQADGIKRETEHLDEEVKQVARKATLFDIAEIGLEVGIVLCSISLLTKTALYWRLSFASSAAGLGLALYGLLVK